MTKRCSSAYRSWTSPASTRCSLPARKPPHALLRRATDPQRRPIGLKKRALQPIHRQGPAPSSPCPGGAMPSEDEARNVAPRNAQFWAYLALVTAAGVTLTVTSLLHLTGHDFLAMGGSFIVVASLLVLSELRPLM